MNWKRKRIAILMASLAVLFFSFLYGCGGSGSKGTVSQGTSNNQSASSSTGNKTKSSSNNTSNSAANKKVLSIRVGLQNIPDDYIVQGKDWGKPYHLKESYSISPSATRSFQQLFANQVDMINAGSGPTLSALSKAPNKLLLVGVRHRGGKRLEVVVRKGSAYQSVKDLLGKRIGIPVGSGAYIGWEGYLQKHGWTDKNFKIVNMKPNVQKQALVEKQVDAAVSWEPTPSFIITSGVGKEIANFGNVTEDPNFFVTTKKYAKSHGKEITRFLAANIDVAHFLENNPKAAAEMAVKVAKKQGVTVSVKAFERAFSKMNIDPAIKNSDIQDLKPVVQYMIKSGVFQKAPDYASEVNKSYFQAAEKLVASK